MSWLIIRVQPAEAETYPENDPRRPPEIETIVRKCRKGRGSDDFDLVERLMDEHGYIPGPLIGGYTPARDWPLTGIVYESPNKDGCGRHASQVRRWPMKRKE